MVITYFGNGAYRLQSGETSILLDSENNRLKADLIIKTLIAPFAPLGDSLDVQTISFPGEYEIKGIEIAGFPVTEESTGSFLKTAYCVFWEDMKFVFLGHLSKPLPAYLMEEFAEPDVLILPVGGGHFLEPDVAAKMVKQLEATIVLPSFAKNPEDFLKSLGKKAESVEKFVFKKKDLVGEKGRPVILEASK
jgi:L-ascorbate metabolism protein UlaG (beta-lactamase superfamily)